MGDISSPSPGQPQGPRLDKVRNSAQQVANELVERLPQAEIRGPEDYYLLDEDLVALIKEPLAVLGLPIETQPVVMYDYDPNFKYNFYRIPLAEGYLGLIYLRNRVTEAYQPTNNLAQLFDWLTQANEHLKIRAVCFFSDGESVSHPYRTMASTWVKRKIVRFAEFVDNIFIKDLTSLEEPEQLRIALARIFERPELAPRSAQPGPGTPKPGGQQTPSTVEALDNDPDKKNRLVNVFDKYFSDSLPEITAKTRAFNLIGKTNWPETWKEDRQKLLTDIATTNALQLVEHAINLGYFNPPGGPQQSLLLSLLEGMKPSLGESDQKFVANLITDFNL